MLGDNFMKIQLQFLSLLFLLLCFGQAQVDFSRVELQETLGLGTLSGVTYSS